VSNDADDFMGGSSKGVQFEEVGDTVTGLILARPEKRQQTDPQTGKPKTFDDGSPRYMFVVRIQTELRDPEDQFDTGERSLFLKWKSLDAVRSAIKATGAKGLEPGGFLTLTLAGFGPKPKGLNAPKLWSAAYVPPNPNDAFMAETPAQPAAAAAEPMDRNRLIAQQQEAIARLKANREAVASMRTSAVQPDEPPF
jgi:hypothetical protein